MKRNFLFALIVLLLLLPSPSQQQTRVIDGGVANVNVAGQGYFWGGTVTTPFVQTGVAVISANQVRVIQFVLPYQVTIRNIVGEVTTLAAGSNLGLGLYDASGNRLAHSGAIDSSTTGIKSVAISPVNINSGVYFSAHTSDSTVVQIRQVNLMSAANAGILNQNGTKVGTAGNASVAGVLPTTLGTIAGASIPPAATLFEP